MLDINYINYISFLLGTIADREHRKWTEKAIPLQNNPYTKESIEKRLQRISGDASNRRGQKAVIDNVTSGREVIVDRNEPSRIDCGLKNVDPSLYRRDYYVNSNGRNQDAFIGSEIGYSTRSDGDSSNASDDGNYSSSIGSSSTERRSSSNLSSPDVSRNSSTNYSSSKGVEQSFKKHIDAQPSQNSEQQQESKALPFQKHLSRENMQPVQGKSFSKNRYIAKNALKTNKCGDSISSSIEKLHDSLEDPSAIDSGLGSSCEYKSKVNKD